MKTKVARTNAQNAQNRVVVRSFAYVCAQKRLPAQCRTTYRATSRASSMPFLVISGVRSSVVSSVTRTANALATKAVRKSIVFDIPRKL